MGVQLKKRMKRSPRSKEFEVLGAWLRECFWLENGEGPPSVPRDVAAAVFFGERAEGAFGAARPVAEAAVKFDAGACFADGTRERLGDLDLVLRGEMDGLLDCARRSFPQWKSSVPRSGDAAADLIEACVRVRTGISQQYLYRSLYAAQLHRCLRGGVDRRDVLVLDSAELRSQPQAALDVVSDRAGLPRHAFASAREFRSGTGPVAGSRFRRGCHVAAARLGRGGAAAATSRPRLVSTECPRCTAEAVSPRLPRRGRDSSPRNVHDVPRRRAALAARVLKAPRRVAAHRRGVPRG